MFLLAVLLQIALPTPTGFVTDAAHLLSPQVRTELENHIRLVRDSTHGELAIVTLPTIGDRDVADVALQIGRAWGVGAKAEIGDPTRNTGVVLLVVPPNNGHRGAVRIEIGRGAEGFLTDARSGEIKRAILPELGAHNYNAAITKGERLITESFLETLHPKPPLPADPVPVWLIFLIVLTGAGMLAVMLKWAFNKADPEPPGQDETEPGFIPIPIPIGHPEIREEPVRHPEVREEPVWHPQVEESPPPSDDGFKIGGGSDDSSGDTFGGGGGFSGGGSSGSF